jgi:hypothetical protein
MSVPYVRTYVCMDGCMQQLKIQHRPTNQWSEVLIRGKKSTTIGRRRMNGISAMRANYKDHIRSRQNAIAIFWRSILLMIILWPEKLRFTVLKSRLKIESLHGAISFITFLSCCRCNQKSAIVHSKQEATFKSNFFSWNPQQGNNFMRRRQTHTFSNTTLCAASSCHKSC